MAHIQSKARNFNKTGKSTQDFHLGYAISMLHFSVLYYSDFCKRSALITTDKELSDIATAASIGVNNKPVNG